MAATEGNLVGDVLLSASFVSYAGAFNAELRRELVTVSLLFPGGHRAVAPYHAGQHAAAAQSMQMFWQQQSVSCAVLQEKWLPDIRQRAIPASAEVDPLNQLTDEPTKVLRGGRSTGHCFACKPPSLAMLPTPPHLVAGTVGHRGTAVGWAEHGERSHCLYDLAVAAPDRPAVAGERGCGPLAGCLLKAAAPGAREAVADPCGFAR